MPDAIAAAFKGPWRLQPAPVKGGDLAIVQVMLCQEAWRQLTKRSRRALLALAGKPETELHHTTRACLLVHGLIDDQNRLTHSGRLVVRHRPRRPVIDVHLPVPAEVNS